MSGLRFLEVAAISADATAVKTFSGRWFRVALDYEAVLALIGKLANGGAISPSDQAAKALREALIDGCSLVGTRPAAPSHIPVVLMLGASDLCTRLREGSPFLQRAPLEELSGYRPGISPAAVVLVIQDSFGTDELKHLASEFAAARQPWTAFVVADGRGWLAPVYEPEGELDHDDLIGRLRANETLWPGLEAEQRQSLGDWSKPDGTCLAWMSSVVAADLARYAAGQPFLAEDHLIELDPATLSVIRHRVLPLPWRDKGQPRGDASGRPDYLVDDRTGVVSKLTRFSHHPSVPSELISVHAHVSRMRRLGPWRTDTTTAGTSFTSEDMARQAAIGEAVERYSGNLIQPELLRECNWYELTEAGEHAVDPDDLVLFSARQHATHGFPFVPLTRDLRIHWLRGRSLTRNCQAWIPAPLAYVNWRLAQYHNSPPLSNAYFAGLAAGQNLEFAIVSGLQEIVERHITMIWWANAQPLPAIRGFPPKFAALWSGAPEKAGMRAWLIPLKNEFGIPVMAGAVEHVSDKLLTMGFAARSDPEQAALKAWAEGLTLQDGARILDQPAGGYRQAARLGDVLDTYVKPWRADRLYLDDYRADFRDVTDLMCQLQIFLDPRAADRVRPWADPAGEINLSDVRPLGDNSLAGYQKAIEAQGYEIFYSDLTTRDVQRAGMRAVRVMVPGLVGNFAAAFPYHGKGRLRNAAVDLGWRTVPLKEEDINVFPLPHA